MRPELPRWLLNDTDQTHDDLAAPWEKHDLTRQTAERRQRSRGDKGNFNSLPGGPMGAKSPRVSAVLQVMLNNNNIIMTGGRV